ncbi:hypothetical protein [Rhizocola hellebori]|uniref:hypothetical protein n=1 Tax=Rhizocola hellebori TaxID=1392758 RepID=UPI0019421F25|nr:hypothetical protein [Rhizocola hellebori]
MNLRSLPPAARAVATALHSAVSAASRGEAEELREAAGELAGLDSEQTGTVQGMVSRMLLEEQHPDGLDGDDIRAVLEGCTRWAASWLPETDPHVLLIVLAGALGIHPEEHEGVPRPTPSALAVHAPILIAHLLSAPARELDPYLTAVFAELARNQTMEAP